MSGVKLVQKEERLRQTLVSPTDSSRSSALIRSLADCLIDRWPHCSSAHSPRLGSRVGVQSLNRRIRTPPGCLEMNCTQDKSLPGSIMGNLCPLYRQEVVSTTGFSHLGCRYVTIQLLTSDMNRTVLRTCKELGSDRPNPRPSGTNLLGCGEDILRTNAMVTRYNDPFKSKVKVAVFS